MNLIKKLSLPESEYLGFTHFMLRPTIIYESKDKHVFFPDSDLKIVFILYLE